MDVLQRIGEQVKSNPVVIFMKGTPQFPMCGFSSRAAQALQDCGIPFAHVNVLADQEIFENLPRYVELAAGGQLKKLMEAATAKAGDEPAS
jgi:monothiol glutaredoxin